jgi:hypothetical protein
MRNVRETSRTINPKDKRTEVLEEIRDQRLRTAFAELMVELVEVADTTDDRLKLINWIQTRFDFLSRRRALATGGDDE